MDQSTKFDITKTLALCPRCLTQGTLQIIYTNPERIAPSCAVMCGCNLTGPSRHTVELAIAAWNVATSQPPAESIGCECSAPDNPTEPMTRESKAIRHANR